MRNEKDIFFILFVTLLVSLQVTFGDTLPQETVPGDTNKLLGASFASYEY
jgi:hypothetical protein